MKRGIAIALLLIIPALWCFSDDTTTPVAEPYGKEEFPAWISDIRRAEIISFGIFPFATFFTSTYYGYYRYFQHDQASGYEPWPLTNSETAIALTEDEQMQIVLVSAAVSVGGAIIDYGVRTVIRLIRESQANRHNDSIPDPIRIESINDATEPDNAAVAAPTETSSVPAGAN